MMNRLKAHRAKRAKSLGGFTLLELIVVMAILSILAVATVFVLDPLEMIARANDTTRLSDLSTIDDALQLAVANGPTLEKLGTDLDGSKTNTCVGESAQTVYVSVPNSETPPDDLPTGWGYGQVAKVDLGRVDGNGWIPVDFTNNGNITPALSNLPLDPINTFGSGYFYTYVCARNPHFELTARMASDRYWTGGLEDKASTDGGDDPLVYETGTNIDLNPLGPVAYWPLNGGTSGTISENDTVGLEDVSGNGSDGRADNNDASGMSWVAGVRGGAVDFDGADDYVDLGNPTALQLIDSETISLWLKPSDFSVRRNPFAKAYGGENTMTQEMSGSLNYYYGTFGGNNAPYQGYTSNAGDLTLGSWTHMVLVRDLLGMRLYWYVNGIYEKDGPASYAQAVASSLNAYIGRGYVSNFAGTIDEVALYDRALTAVEIGTIYNMLKP